MRSTIELTARLAEILRKHGAGATFFLVDPLRRSGGTVDPDWTALRDQWEYAHLLRALLGLLSLTLLAAAVAM